MTSATEPRQAEPRTYGNWSRPSTPGLIPGLGMIGTAIMFSGLVLMVMFIMAGNWAIAIGILTITGITLLLIAVKDIHGRSLAGRIVVIAAWKRGHAKKRTIYQSGLLGISSHGEHRLPGLLAPMRLYESHDAAHRPFAVVYSPQQHTYTVVIGTSPSGEDLVDADQIDLWVARWGRFQADMGDEPGLTSFSVTVETAPATSARLRREVELNMVDDAQPFSVAVLKDILASYPKGSNSVQAYVALTYSDMQTASSRRRRRDEMIGDLMTRIPHLTAALEATGAGACTPLGARELCETIRIAYDPAVCTQFDDMHASGERGDIEWEECGPVAARNNWDHYMHDSGISVTWEMTEAPRGVVHANVLTRLLAPQHDVLRKRVTLLYRPISPARTPDIVETDARTADFAVNSADKPSARALRRQKAARQTANEEASGAGMVNFGMLVTVTMDHERNRADVMATLDNLAASARIRIRPVYGSQSSAFAACLPLGLNLRQHLMIPAEFTDKL